MSANRRGLTDSPSGRKRGPRVGFAGLPGGDPALSPATQPSPNQRWLAQRHHRESIGIANEAKMQQGGLWVVWPVFFLYLFFFFYHRVLIKTGSSRPLVIFKVRTNRFSGPSDRSYRRTFQLNVKVKLKTNRLPVAPEMWIIHTAVLKAYGVTWSQALLWGWHGNHLK